MFLPTRKSREWLILVVKAVEFLQFDLPRLQLVEVKILLEINLQLILLSHSECTTWCEWLAIVVFLGVVNEEPLPFG